MTPYCVQCGGVTDEHLELLTKVRRELATLPSILNCHQVCDELCRRIDGLRHIRGHFFIHGVEHSWLVVKSQLPGPEVIIDPYPIAVASGPILVTTDGILNPWRFMYRASE